MIDDKYDMLIDKNNILYVFNFKQKKKIYKIICYKIVIFKFFIFI